MRVIYPRPAALGLLFALTVSTAAAKEEVLQIKTADEKLVAPLNIPSLNRLTAVALSGTPSRLGGFLSAFDRRLDTAYEAREPGEAQIVLSFTEVQRVQSVRLLLGDTTVRAEWSVESADTYADLARKAGSYRMLLAPRERLLTGQWEEGKLPTQGLYKVLRLSVKPADPEQRVTLWECNLVSEQTLQAINLSGPTSGIPLGRAVPLEVQGYFSGGEVRAITSKALKWEINPPQAARIGSHHQLDGRRKGPFQVSVRLDKRVAPPLSLEIVDAD